MENLLTLFFFIKVQSHDSIIHMVRNDWYQIDRLIPPNP